MRRFCTALKVTRGHRRHLMIRTSTGGSWGNAVRYAGVRWLGAEAILLAFASLL